MGLLSSVPCAQFSEGEEGGENYEGKGPLSPMSSGRGI